MRNELPSTPPLPPHARWRSLARMLRARHARHAGRQPLDAVLRRPAMELFQPQGARVSSHLSFNCFVTLKVAARAAAPATAAVSGRGKDRGVMAGGVIRERVMVVERHLASSARGGARLVSSPIPSFVSRTVRTAATSSDMAPRRQSAAAPVFSTRDDVRRSIGSNSPMSMFAAQDADGRVFAAPRGLLQTEEAAQAFGRLARRLRRHESRMTPVAAVPTVARRASEAPRSERDEMTERESTFTAPRIGMGMPTAMQMQAAADVNIEALASKVMQQIDRRLVAHRERMGRI